MTKQVGVGSLNPVKVAAVIEALSDKMPEIVVKGIAIASNVSEQPMSDEETRNGALERALGALDKLSADVGVGLEGGVNVEDGQVWNTVWCVVVDNKGRKEMVNGVRFVLPEKLSNQILHGKEMGPAMDSLTGVRDVKKKMGMLGIVTDGWVDRKSEYVHLVRLAMGRLLSDWR